MIDICQIILALPMVNLQLQREFVSGAAANTGEDGAAADSRSAAAGAGGAS